MALAIRDAPAGHVAQALRSVTADELAAAADRLRARLHDEGPISRKDMDAFRAGSRHRRRALGGPGAGPAVGHVGAAPGRPLRPAETWLGPPPAELTVDAAQEHLVRRYLGGFGPATPNEIATGAACTSRR